MPRVALLAAMPFPLPQGSQVFVAEQAIALARAGASVTVMCYGDGVDSAGAGGGVAARCDDAPFRVPRLVRAPRALSRTPLRAGPSWRKPLADLALLGCFAREARRQRFDVVLAHNAEAVVVGLAARSVLHIPVVYVAHTLLRCELSAYAPRALAPWADAAGTRLDAALAGNADAVIALSGEAEARLAAATHCPVVRIPPALGADEPPIAEHVAKTCALHGLSEGGFVLYAGNLDAYQDLDDLVHVAARIAPVPVVVATHERRRAAPAPVRTLRIDDVATLRRLTHGAALCVVARRRPGGFPVKLLNYLEAARAVVAHAQVGDGLTHNRNAWLLTPGSSADAVANAVAELLRDPIRCARLGAAGRAHLVAHHDPAARATEVLALIERVLR